MGLIGLDFIANTWDAGGVSKNVNSSSFRMHVYVLMQYAHFSYL